MFELRGCTVEDAISISSRLREEDLEELRACGYEDAQEALLASIALPGLSLVDCKDGVPEMIGGITDDGVIWCMTTRDYITNHRKRFHKVTTGIMKEHQGVLWNYVYSKNEVHVEWLKRVGFTIKEPAVPIGPNDELFYYFTRSA